ncbi:di-heme oxidoredictase family protein [Paraglaciecola aquimarina]|uniref:Di-heme oxidoredictase family protein n=2 Tax=Paraglaciecola aquimarina TaxID=1235557 RepID=A0ABU3SVJ1_9ALTE|nr:di-heme oxidoredictase family protein [Paraglaciecola aquimarina]MDU0354019.1 di-heme oxidoredictase family protein [Paraglaciecola aquimarina]
MKNATITNISKPLQPIMVAVALTFLTACGGGSDSPTTPEDVIPPTPVPQPELDHSGLTPLKADTIDDTEYLSGGDATVFVADEDAFSTRPNPIADDFTLDGNFTSGDHIFRTPHDGAGPLLNTSNCQGCHLNDGRGVLPSNIAQPFTSMLVKIGDGSGAPDPVYGDQLQTFAEQSFSTSDFASGWPRFNGSTNGDVLLGEAYTYIEFAEVTGSYPDGTSYSLRSPVYKTKDLSFGEFTADIRFSPRIAPQVFGVGLLEAIPEQYILALADEDDTDQDGISGRASMVTDVLTNKPRLGRFAYKAQAPSVLQQVAGAYRGDIGITSNIFIEEPCTNLQTACLNQAERETNAAGQADISDLELAQVEFYNRVLGVPARRGFDQVNAQWNADVAAGRQAFFETGCIGCHTPRHVTEEAAGSVLGEIAFSGLEENAAPIDMLSNQTIYPYTDLLLHDMGGSCTVTRETKDEVSCTSGEECMYVQRCDGLADDLVQGMASGTEWKTPALWGIGLVQTVNPDATFLHDGRARTIEEAILWHGGEAENSLTAFKQLNQNQRAQVLTFIESL